MQHDIEGQHEEQLPIAVARTLMEEVSRRNISARLLGGIAIYLRCPAARSGSLARTYNDIDVAVSLRDQKALGEVLVAQGFVGDRQFNTLYGQKRQLFAKGAFELDVFVRQFEQCHTLDLEARMTDNPLTLSLADLLLTKLQVVQLTQKDITDSLALLVDHAIERNTADALDPGTVAKITGQDWGWYTTVHDNLKKIEEVVRSFLNEDDATLVRQHIATLRQAMEDFPKSFSWKMRAKIGRRVAWYALPEDK